MLKYSVSARECLNDQFQQGGKEPIWMGQGTDNASDNHLEKKQNRYMHIYIYIWISLLKEQSQLTNFREIQQKMPCAPRFHDFFMVYLQWLYLKNVHSNAANPIDNMRY